MRDSKPVTTSQNTDLELLTEDEKAAIWAGVVKTLLSIRYVKLHQDETDPAKRALLEKIKAGQNLTPAELREVISGQTLL